MASLFVKNSEAATLAAEVAELRGVTKTTAVVDALRKERDALRPKAECIDPLEWIRQYRHDHPLPPPTGLQADKAFFDELWDEK